MSNIKVQECYASGFDPFAPNYLDDAQLMVSRIHQTNPVFFYEPLNFWCVSKYEDVKALLKDWKAFSSRSIGLIPPPAGLVGRVRDIMDERLIIATDPPLHTLIRQPIIKLFNAEALRAVEPALRKNANELIDVFYERGQCDFMREFAYPISLATIMMLFDMPRDRAANYRQWSDDFISMLTIQRLGTQENAPEHPMPAEEVRQRWMRLAEANAFFRGLVESRRLAPGKDLISAMLQVKDEDGGPALDDAAVIVNAVGLMTAGHDTTANLIGSLAMLLLRNPGQWDLLEDDPLLINRAIDETLRRHGSAKAVIRHALEDVTIRGVTIPKDSYIFLMLTAANMDPEVFPDPGRFDISRDNAGENLTFGFGRHSCLGKMIAKLEARVAFEEFFKRIPRFRLRENGLTVGPALTAVNLTELTIEW